MNVAAGWAIRERSYVALEATALRWPSAAVIGAGVVLPMLGHPGPGCLLRAATGVPCPLCGMSSSVEDTLRLDLAGALRANPAGLLVVVGAIAALVVRRDVTLRIPVSIIYLGLVAMWVFQLVRFGLV